MSRAKITKILVYFWIANLAVGLVVVLTNVSLNPGRLFYFQILAFLTGLPIVYWYNKRTKSSRLLAVFTFATGIVGIAFFYFFLDWSGEWKTQTIQYQHADFSNRTIEFQLQDIGALGYNKRHIERTKILPFFEWIKEVDPQEVDTLIWKEVNVYVNEMGFKGG